MCLAFYGEAEERRSGGAEERRSGRADERTSGRAVERWRGGAEWRFFHVLLSRCANFVSFHNFSPFRRDGFFTLTYFPKSSWYFHNLLW